MVKVYGSLRDIEAKIEAQGLAEKRAKDNYELIREVVADQESLLKEILAADMVSLSHYTENLKHLETLRAQRDGVKVAHGTATIALMAMQREKSVLASRYEDLTTELGRAGAMVLQLKAGDQ